MEPQNIRFGGGAAESSLHPVIAIWMIIAILLIWVLPRNKVIAAFLLAFFTIPVGEVVLIGGMHFTALRILILGALARVIYSSVSSPSKAFTGGFNRLDQAVMLWSLSSAVVFCLQWRESQAIIYSFGDLIDTLGGYFVVRFLIPDADSVRRTVKALALVCFIQGICMIEEHFRGQNIFALVGGIPTVARDGEIRSQGVLGCINAGVFAGIAIPVFIWLWFEKKSRLAAAAGIAGSMAMVITSYSSTSWLALAGSLAGLAFWPLRKQMRIIRWGIAIALISLHMVMKAPVWALIERVDLTGSSSSGHRYMLVDMTVRHFADWWLLGSRNYASWGWDMWDTCNQFVAIAMTGGLVTLALYILILKRGFSFVGNTRKLVSGERSQEWLNWCMGASLFCTVVSAFGINYMTQLLMLLFPLLACISTASFMARESVRQELHQISEQTLLHGSASAAGALPSSA